MRCTAATGTDFHESRKPRSTCVGDAGWVSRMCGHERSDGAPPHLDHRLDRLDAVGRPIEHLEADVLQRPHQRQDVAVGAARIEQCVLELTVDDDE